MRTTELQTMHRRVAAKVGRMDLAACRAWVDEYAEATARQDSVRTGTMVSRMTGCSEPSRSQNIRSQVVRRVWDRLKRLERQAR